MKIFTKTIENFLNENEIIEIENMHLAGLTQLKIDDAYNKPKNIARTANYFHFDFYNDSAKQLREILLPKLQNEFHKDIYIDDCHILESFYPYDVHTDAVEDATDGTVQAKSGYKSAWTFIIPLDNYDSHTIIFEQEVPLIKVPYTWIKNYNPPILDSISDEVYEKYLKRAVYRDQSRYLSIEEIFPWRKGWLSATSRGKFHCSDDFLSKGIEVKRAIVMWTTIPI